VLPALAEFEHGPEVQKAAFSELLSNLSSVIENQLTNLKRELLQEPFLDIADYKCHVFDSLEHRRRSNNSNNNNNNNNSFNDNFV